MAVTIQIKRSTGTSAPGSLADGELAYTHGTGTQGNLGDRLFIGDGSSVNVIGGQYFGDMLDHVAGTLTASGAVIVDSNKAIDELLVGNHASNGGAVKLNEGTGNGSNYVALAAPNSVTSNTTWTLPDGDGSADQVIKTDGSGALGWATSSSAADDISVGDAAVTISTSSGNITLDATADNTDIIFKGTDDTADITMLTLDGSDAGAATFNSAITGGGLLTTGGNIVIPDAGYIGSASDTDAIAIASDGVVTFSQEPVLTLGSAAQTNITSLGTLTALTVDDVAIDGKVVTMTGSTSDTVVFTAGTNGTLDITTTDDAAAAANIQITADGTAELAGTTVTLDSGGGITLDADGGTITFADGGASLGTISSSGWTGAVVGNVTGNASGTALTVTQAAQTSITSLGTLTALTVDDVAIDGKVVTMTGSSGDTAVFTAGTNGTLDITTTDTAAAAANIQITADGTAELAGTTVTLDSSGGVTIDADGGTITFADGGASLGTISSSGWTGAVVGNVTGNASGTALTVTQAAQTSITSLGTLTALTVDDVAIDGKVISMTGSTSDTAVFTAGTNGTLSIVTTDDAAAAANITITADGTFEADGTTITLDSAGDIVLDADGGDVFFKDGGTTFGSATNTSGNLIVKSGTTTALTFSGANVTGAGTYTGGGLMTTGGNIVIPDAGNIGSASDTDSLAISSGGVVTFSQAPVFPNGSLDILDLDIDGGTDIGAALVDGDLLVVDDGAGGTNRKTAISRVKTYIADVTLTTAAQTAITTVGDLNGLTIASSQTIDMGSNRVTGVADPSSAQDAATKAYVDAVKTGLDVKDSVVAASTANGTLSSAFENGDTMDGVTLATGDRILLKDQSSGAENGIYTVASSGAPTRATDFDADSEVTAGAFTFVEEGTTNADSGWVLTTNDAITVGTTAQTWAQFSGAGQITAGDGLAKTGNTLSVGVDDSSIEINSDALRVKASGVTNTMLAGSIDLTAKVTGTLPIGNGGTGLTAAAKGTVIVANSANTLSALDGGGSDDGLLAYTASADTIAWATAVDGGTF